MKRRSFLKNSATVGASTFAAGAFAACSPSSVDPNSGANKNAGGSAASNQNNQPTIRLRMVTTWAKNFPGLGTRAVEFAEDIEKATNGRIIIRVYAAEELVPALQAFDAVSQGNADIYHGPDYYWQGKHPMFNFFGAVPFGLTATEMTQWLQYGGGQELWDELSGRFNVKPMLCNATGVQMGGWFNKEINSVEDFQGLKMRIPALGGEIIKRLGGTPVTLPGGDIFLSLSQGNIDATIEALAEMHFARSLAEFNDRNAGALRTLVEEHGVQLREFSPEIMEVLSDTAADVAQGIGMTDDISKRIYNSYMQTFDNVMKWKAIADEPYATARRLSYLYGRRV